MEKFSALINKKYKNKIVLAIDPGEITGICVHKGIKLIKLDEYKSFDLMESFDYFSNYIDLYEPDIITMESYILYGHKAKAQSWSKLHTPLLIGGIMNIIRLKCIHLTMRNAQTAKNEVTDEHLKAWGYYYTKSQAIKAFNLDKGKISKAGRHYIDAQRHCLVELIQGDLTSKLQVTTTNNRISEEEARENDNKLKKRIRKHLKKTKKLKKSG